MTKYVALLRGINVGGRIVKMADLKSCLEQAGLQHVQTLLQSGNVSFESEQPATELKPKIEAALDKAFHYPAKVQVLAQEQLVAIVGRYPFGEPMEGMHDYVIFMEDGLEAALVKESYELRPQEKVRVGEGVVYWRVDKGSTLKSSFAKVFAKSNIQTVQYQP